MIEKIVAILLAAAGFILAAGRLIQKLKNLERRMDKMENEAVPREVFDLQMEHHKELVNEVKEGMDGVKDRIDNLTTTLISLLAGQHPGGNSWKRDNSGEAP